MLRPTHVALLAPMHHELQPLVARLDLESDGAGRFVGSLQGVPVVAVRTDIGMDAARAAARSVLGLGADLVVVVGIAGAVARDLEIGDVIVPAAVVDRASGRSYRPTVVGDHVARGTISCGDDLIVDPDALARLRDEDVVALDMETAAVAEVCEAAGCAWTVFRSVSDRPDDGLVDDGLFVLTLPDGSADPDALARYLADDPARAERLARLARDMETATSVAADAAIAAVRSVIVV
ncbi:MAG TPA: hypothetical protein VFZ83_08715 [Acidimicrobiia bacterium]|nr:hypothetical protein [Acidimicrobiia bacterium]